MILLSATEIMELIHVLVWWSCNDANINYFL